MIGSTMLSCASAWVLAAVIPGGVMAQSAPAWLLVRSDAEAVGSLSWERLAAVYLRRDYSIVRADAPVGHHKASRLVVGTPDDNAVVRTLAGRLGITFTGKRCRYGAREYPDDAGLVVVTSDPDGGGTLVLMTGATGQGVHACLSVPVDLHRHGFIAMTMRKVIHRGEVGAESFKVDHAALPVVRLDRELWQIRDQFSASSLDEAALRVSRAFAGYRFLFAAAGHPDIDLLSYTRKQFRDDEAVLAATRKCFAEIDLATVFDREERRVATALGGRKGPRPIVYTVVMGRRGTNAQVIGADPQTGRLRVNVNLAWFEDLDSLRVAIVHEFVHTLQSDSDGTLLGRAVHEGAAVYLSQRLCAGTADHSALMWTPEKLAAAHEHRGAILAEFRRLADSRDVRKIGAFIYGDRPLRAVSGAPDRCAYYVGWLAVARWHDQHPERPLADLLKVPPAEIFAALVE